MSKHREVMLRILGGGAMSQDEVAAVEHVSKSVVSECARVIREEGLTLDGVRAMGAKEVEDRWFPRARREPDDAYLQPDVAHYVERKRRGRKITRLMLWTDYVAQARAEGRLHYSYQTFCRRFEEEARRTGATRHFEHEPGAKAYVDWAGDVAHLTDAATGRKPKVYVLVVVLPFSGKFWAEGFCDMRQASWHAGQAHAFEFFGGVPRLLVPDNAATATNRHAPAGATVLNEEYERFADHYGTAVLPARVRSPRDKSTSETVVNLTEQWVVAPSEEMEFRTVEEFNEFCLEKVLWLNARPFSGKDGSRDSVFEAEERDHLLPLPATPYESCSWSRPKVSPDYHVQVAYMRYSVPFDLVGRTVDAKATQTTVTIMDGGEVVAAHKRLYGRKGQYSTDPAHMPPAHLALDDAWSADRFSRWARRVGPECEAAISRLMSRHPIVQQSFVACRNILGLSKKHGPELLERACARPDEVDGYPTYTGLKNRVIQIRAEDAASAPAPEPAQGAAEDRARGAGLTRGADEYRMPEGGDPTC